MKKITGILEALFYVGVCGVLVLVVMSQINKNSPIQKSDQSISETSSASEQASTDSKNGKSSNSSTAEKTEDDDSYYEYESDEEEIVEDEYTKYIDPPYLPNTEGCTQLVYIEPNGYSASMMYYEYDGYEWELLCTCGAAIGKKGVSSNKKESDGFTPTGEYPLLYDMAISKPITRLNFKQLNSTSVFVTDSQSKYYNTLQDRYVSDCDFTTYEKIYERYFKGGTHKNMIYIGYNGDGLSAYSAEAGKGSMITLCGKTESLEPTAGCIDIFDTDMTKLLRYLDSDRNPVIIIKNNENTANK